MVSQSSSETGDGETLAGGSANEDVGAAGEIVERDFREVAIVLYSWVMMSEDCGRKFVDFGKANRLPAERPPGNRSCFDSRAN